MKIRHQFICHRKTICISTYQIASLSRLSAAEDVSVQRDKKEAKLKLFSYLLILTQIFDFSRRFFSKMLIGFTLSSLDLLVLQINSGDHLKGLNPVIVFVY